MTVFRVVNFPCSCEAECILSQLYWNSTHLYWKMAGGTSLRLDEATLGGGCGALEWDGDCGDVRAPC